MNEQDQERLSAYLDGALDASEARALERALAGSTELAAELAFLRAQDAALGAAFAPLREAVERRAQELALPAPAPEAREPVGGVRPWLWLAAGAAAGVLATGSLLRWGRAPAAPAVPTAPVAPATQPFARLEQALGTLELVADASGIPLTTGAELAPGVCVRTAARAKGTLALADGTRLFLDADSELVLAGPRVIALRRGRVFADVFPTAEPFRAEAGASLVEVLGTRLDLFHGTGAPGSEHAGRALTELTLLEGSALLCGTRVEAGQIATAVDGRFVHAREAQDLLLVTSWVNELLAFDPEREREFQERVDALLAMLGRTKVAHLYEWEIRSLGDHCALPLLRYVESEGSRAEGERRREAARILADVAVVAQLDGLAALLDDADPEVRVAAARGFARLTGETFGEGPDTLRQADFAERAARWRAWLEER